GELDVVMFNHYNTPSNLSDAVFWFDFLRTLKDRPFWNTETATTWNGSTAIGQVLKPEGYCRVNSWLPVALGGECNMYWLWRQHWAGHELVHGSVLTPEGRPVHAFGEVQRTAAEYEKASAFIAGTKVKTDVALHFTNKSWQLFDQQKVFDGNWYAGDVQQVHRAMLKGGVRPDVIGATHSLDGYKLLVSPCVMTLEDGDLAAKIRKFVEDGGVWVAGPLTDVRNAIGAHYTDRAMGMMEEWLGIRQDYGIPTDGSVLRTAWTDGEELHVRKWAENYTNLGGGEVLASVTGGHSALVGEVVIGRYRVGKGEVILCGALLEDADLSKLLSIAYADAGITPYETTGTLNVVPREGEAGEGLILCETAHAPASVRIGAPMTDLLTGEMFEDEIPVEPYGVRVMKKN
ncbi:MAG: beta-galactosidase trimerization domain-containing protein, partial [Clostridia bacterium]|nr:beta-galactosidase trimerization domain-containing protein [Clostridia bacterium]